MAATKRKKCPTCGERIARRSRFCPHCGSPVDGWEETAVLETPPHETGPVPVTIAHAEPRYFGLAPPTLLFGGSAVSLALAVGFFVTGHWPVGLILLGLSFLLAAAFLEVARRKPDTAVRRSTQAFGALRSRAGVALESISARSTATREVMRLQRELRALGMSRSERVLALGEAALRQDRKATSALRDEIRDLEEQAAAKEEEIAHAVEDAEDRIRRAQLQVQPTEMIEVPYPPPDEGTPPTPAPVPERGPEIVPEPYPPPDEADPPTVPEPEPPESE
jgi:hypothetical protein